MAPSTTYASILLYLLDNVLHENLLILVSHYDGQRKTNIQTRPKSQTLRKNITILSHVVREAFAAIDSEDKIHHNYSQVLNSSSIKTINRILG